MKNGKYGTIGRKQIQYGQALRKVFPDIDRYNHIPYPECNKELFRLEDKYICKTLHDLMNYADSHYIKIAPRIIDLLDTTERNLTGLDSRSDNQTKHVYKSIMNMPKIMQASKWFKPFLFWFTIKTEVRAVVKESSKTSKLNHPNIVQIQGEHYYIQINQNLTSIIDKRYQKIYYCTVEMVLMYCDVLEGRLMIDTGMSCDPKYTVLSSRGNRLWELIDSLFVDLGNNVYNIVSMLEPLTLGILQLQDHATQLAGTFIHYCAGEIINELRNNGFVHPQDAENLFDEFVEIMSLDDIHLVGEFFSFFRTFGHPTLEAITAADKVRSHMQKPKMLEFLPIMKAHAIFCGIIINGYRDRHGGAWPPLTLPNHASPVIRRLQSNGESLTHAICVNEWKSFCGLHFKCFMPLELDSDLSMYMKDKALSPLKSEWDTVYPKENMKYMTGVQSTSRRLVDVFVNDGEFDPYNILNYVLSGEYINDPEFNISYSLKEKETKQAGRLFAKMTYKMRACQVVAESLIANGIGRYFKENGMVKDEHELLKTLHQLSVSSVPKTESYNDDPWKINKESMTKLKTKHNVKSDIIQLADSKLFDSSVLNSTTTYQSLGTPRIFRSRAGSETNYKLYNSTSQSKVQNYKYDYRRSSKETEPTIRSDDKYDTISSFLTTDLQKFCLNWRYESTALFAARMDEIYGLPGFFNWLHNRLERSVLYVADPYCPPSFDKHLDLDEVPDEGMFIHNPMGGIEGYSQKLWTIITIPFLFLSGVETNIRIAAVVQGDNQSIAITHKVHPHLSYKVKKDISAQQAQIYFKKLRENLGALGHNLKLTETIISTHFFVYSKRIYYDGMVLSQALKTLSRCVFWSETLVDETRSACSNISTSIAKSIENGLSKDFGYALNILKTLQQLVLSLKFTINETLTPDITSPIINNPLWLLTATLVPAPLGGFNYLNMSRIYVRNIGDPVTASLADIKRMIKSKLLSIKVLQKIMNQAPGDATFLDWASDPYSVNLPSSQSITKTIKNVTARLVLSNSVNPILKGLFHSDFHEEDKSLAKFLMDRNVILPRAAHEILDNSITGAREEIAGMLDTTKGLIRTGLKKGGIQPRLVLRLSHYDYEQFRIFNCLMKNNIENDLVKETTCSVELAKNLRNHMWRNLAYGRTIYGLEVPDPIESLHGLIISGSEMCFKCATEGSPYCWFFIPKEKDLDKVTRPTNSIRVPYIGSSTDERSEIRLGSVKSSSRALKAAIRIATVYTWAYGDDEDSWIEAWYLASQRANIELEVLKAITPISTSNNLAHRLRDRSTQIKFTGSSLNRVSRYVTISNDKIEFKLDDQKIDTNLIFQQVMLMGLSCLEQRFRYLSTTGCDNLIYHLHIVPNCCVIEMSQLPNIPSCLDPPDYKEMVENSLVYDSKPIIEKDLNKLSMQNWRSADVDFSQWTIGDLHICLAQTLAQTVVDIITKTDKDILKHHMSVGLEDNFNSLITEFLLVDLDLFPIYLGQCCALKWAFDIHYKRPTGKWQMIELISDFMSNTSIHVYSILNNALSHPGVFRRFWDAGLLSPQYGPYLYNQDYSKLSQDLLITSYTIYLTVWLEGRKFEYLLAEQNEEAVQSRYELIQARHLAYVCDLYCNDSGPPHIRDLEPMHKVIKLDTFIKECQMKMAVIDAWNTASLPISVYPTSLTYLRRGVIKQIRIRQTISKDFDKMEVDLERSRYNMETRINYKPTETCTCLDLDEVDKPHNSTYQVRLSGERPLNGWESHKHRRVGINSTSGYKALELISVIQRYYQHSTPRLFLGEGSGCMLTVYNQLLGSAKNYYNSGITECEVLGQRELKLYPSEACLADKELGDDSQFLQNIVPLFNGRPETTWVGNNDCFIHLMKRIKSHTLGMVHNDMEGGQNKDDATILREHSHIVAVAVNLLRQEGVLISKIAPEPNFPITSLLSLYRMGFSRIQVAFPKYSNPLSSECYLICTLPKILTMTSPDIILNSVKNKSIDCDRSIINFIFTIKQRVNTAFEMRIYPSFYKNVVCNISPNLTSDDKVLLQCGLTLNGPILCKRVFGYDVGSPVTTLLESSHTLLNEALSLHDKNRIPSSFFEPYPVLEKTRIKYYMIRYTYKTYGYILLSNPDISQKKIKDLILDLKKKIIMVDLNELKNTKLIPKYMFKRIKDSGFKTCWRFKLLTKEVKIWWKLISYAPIFHNNN
uniref:RNA-directed RNA polymerase L n=1 Tax=Chodsigoa hypsibia henipavirus TaxID=3028504 RepID=A0AAT9TTJ8_9MONO|nr:MAG: RNA polymerase [Chodsigoa hypsibia henipavirus]